MGLAPQLRRQLRASGAATLTAIGLKRLGFFVPYAFADDVQRTVAEYPAMTRLFDARAAAFEEQIAGLSRHLPAFRSFADGPTDPGWRTEFFPPRDGAIAYAMVQRFRPRRILEIGSGASTRFLRRAARDAGLDSIDPSPRSMIAALEVRHIARVLREDDVAEAEALEAGDILFIDSSHIMLPGMDVDIEFNMLFPALKPGVVVHVHDIFLPFDYPDIWQAREYSEQNALFGWIYSGFFEVLFGGCYASRRLGDAWSRVAADFPVLSAPASGSIWLRRAGAAPALG